MRLEPRDCRPSEQELALAMMPLVDQGMIVRELVDLGMRVLQKEGQQSLVRRMKDLGHTKPLMWSAVTSCAMSESLACDHLDKRGL